MKSKTPSLVLATMFLIGISVLCGSAYAFDIKVAGFIRQEVAYNIGSKNNPWQRGSPDIYTGGVGALPSTASGHPGAELFWDCFTTGTCADIPGNDLPTGFIKPDLDKDNDWNLNATRAEVDFKMRFTQNLTAFVKVRGYFQHDVQDEYTVPSQFPDGGDDNHFKVENHGQCASALEICDDNFMIDLPSAYFDYQNGPFWLRVGQQQIAWGEAIFFRVLDVPNGLDLRRHSFLDLASEEYADERIGAPAIRVSYNMGNNWEIEAFAQMFQPTVHPRVGTSYAFINSPYVIRNDIGFDNYDDYINGGLRLKGQVGNFDLQFIAVARHNPDPVFKWGVSNQTFYDAVPGLAGFSTQPFKINSNRVVGDPFSPSIGGKEGPFNGTTNSSDWMVGAALSGLDGVETLNVLARDFPFVGGFFTAAFATPPFPGAPVVMPNADPANGIWVTNADEARVAIDTFLSLLGDVGADFIPSYPSENVFGFGATYIFYDEPDSWLDQLIVRFEATYTPDRSWTNNGAQKQIEEDEYIWVFGLEKYHRLSQKFPATYFSFQWMHKSESDFVGHHLSTLGGNAIRGPSGAEEDGGWDAIAIGITQPSPTLKWRFGFSFLYDFNQSWLAQPSVTYKPSGDWTIDLFATVMDSSDYAAALTPIDWTDELTLRLSYQF